jgi:hypothetical protein
LNKTRSPVFSTLSKASASALTIAHLPPGATMTRRLPSAIGAAPYVSVLSRFEMSAR